MAILKVLTHPDEFLNKISKPVIEFDQSLHQLLDDMNDTMGKNCIGIAAPQVGILKRACIILTRDGALELINPEITAGSRLKSGEEACISIPKFQTRVKRYHTLTISAQNRHGHFFQMELYGIDAVCAQHEIDHLNGVLLTCHAKK